MSAARAYANEGTGRGLALPLQSSPSHIQLQAAIDHRRKLVRVRELGELKRRSLGPKGGHKKEA